MNITQTRENVGDADTVFVSIGTLPQGWKKIGSLSTAFTTPLATYRVEKESSISFTVAIGGDVLGNVNRWRGQLGHAKDLTSLSNLEPTVLAGNKGYIYHDTGNFEQRNPDWSMVVAIAEHPKLQLMVFKMIGPKSEVEAHLENFKTASKQLVFKEDVFDDIIN